MVGWLPGKKETQCSSDIWDGAWLDGWMAAWQKKKQCSSVAWDGAWLENKKVGVGRRDIF